MLRFSVIICTYNRSKLLIETIESILNVAKVRNDFELLIIDNNSKDNTKQAVQRFLSDPRVIYKCEYNQGLSHARNRGMEEARGEILVYLDDDIELVDNYFEICDAIFSDISISISGGKVLPYRVDIPKWLPKKYYYLVSVFDLGDDFKIVDTLMGANYAMTKKLAAEVGLYNPELGRKGDNLMGGEENDYLERAKVFGYKITYNPELVVFHKINNKLNKKYVFDYSYQNGKSERIIDESISKLRVIEKTIKSYFAILIHYLLGRLIKNERKRVNLRIINQYAKGYLHQ